MTTNSSFPYPAEYYYPEFIQTRPDEPAKSPSVHLPLTTGIDNGIGSSSKVPTNKTTTTIIKKPSNKKSASTSLALDVVTDQGLPDTDITQAIKTDPKRSLVRDPGERNIPRLIVDDSVIKQAVRTPRIVTTNLDNSFEQKNNSHSTNSSNRPFVNGHVNGDLTKKSPIKYVEHEQPVDEYWKKEVYIDDEGVVTIEPLKYDKNTYEGPFGLTRQGSFIFYIGMAIFTLLAAIFLIMTGVFYGQNYPDSSSNSGKLAGIGICAFAFYLGLQLILIGLWHQKYRQENPTKTIKKRATVHHDSTDYLKSTMEHNEQYDYSYQQPIAYAPYGNYSNPSYISNPNEQMLLQQPGATTGTGFYEPVPWPSNIGAEIQPDPKFLQPMEWTYAPKPMVDSPSTGVGFTSPSNANSNTTATTTTTITKSEKKGHRHHYNKKTIEAEPSKPVFDSIVPNSTVIEPPLPALTKAPETAELIKSIAEMEKNAQQTPTTGSTNRVKSVDDQTFVLPSNDHHQHQHQHHHHRHHSRHRHHSPRRRHHHHHRSYSPCSTCSNRSRNDYYSDIGYNHHHHHYQRKPSEPVEKILTPRPYKDRTPSPAKRNTRTYRDTGMGTGLETKIMKDSSVGADLEDVPNIRDNRLEQIPVIRRTIIVEPYPAEPSSQILVKPRSDMIGKIRLGKNDRISGDDETIVYPSTTFMNKKLKKKKKATEIRDRSIEDLKLDDVNDDDDENDQTKLKKKTNKRFSKKNVKNAFYN